MTAPQFPSAEWFREKANWVREDWRRGFEPTASELDAIAFALDAANAKLPCGCHHSMSDTYGGCVHHITLAALEEKEAEIKRLEGALAAAERRGMERAAEIADACGVRACNLNYTSSWIESTYQTALAIRSEAEKLKGGDVE